MVEVTQVLLPATAPARVWGGAGRRLLAGVARADKGEPLPALFICPSRVLDGVRHPTLLVIQTEGGRWIRRGSEVLATGRITQAVIAVCAGRIDEVFGREVAKDINLKATLWLEREDPA